MSNLVKCACGSTYVDRCYWQNHVLAQPREEWPRHGEILRQDLPLKESPVIIMSDRGESRKVTPLKITPIEKAPIIISKPKLSIQLEKS